MINLVVRHLLFPIAELYDGTSIGRRLGTLEMSQYLPLPQLEDLRMKKLRQILLHSYENVAFYRQRFDEYGFHPETMTSFDDICKIPPLTKDDIVENLVDLTARNISPSNLHRSASGGSTGRHTPFYRDNLSLNVKRAAQFRFDGFAGWRLGDRVAYIWPALQDVSTHPTIRTRIRERLIERRQVLAAGNLSEAILQGIASKLEQFRPALIRAFPNPLAQVATFLKGKPIRIRPQSVLVTGEPLLVSQRSLFQDVFGCPVFDCYASRECGQHACECSVHNGLHINAEGLFLEFERDGKRCGSGEPGRILMTDLDNFGMPFIRYDIQDVGQVLAGSCACGRTLPRMAVTAGRISDFVVSPHDGGLVSGATLCHYCLATGPDVGQIQIIQDAVDHLCIRLRRSSNAGDAEVNMSHIRETLGKIFFGKMKIDILICDSIPHEPSGKYRFCINQILG